MTSRLVAAYGLYYLDGLPALLRAGVFAYWRRPAASWPAAIARWRDAGCNTLHLIVPWAWHAPEPDRTDFTGATHPDRNLCALLDEAHASGLAVVLHPGPVPAGLPDAVPGAAGPGDLPSWLAGVIPEALALGPDGAPAPHRGAPLFSLLHPGYLARVGDWYAAVGAAITPFAPAPVVAWQIDGGTAAAYAGRLGRLDFNEDTVARYNDFLKEQYETTRRLSRAWRRDVPELGTVRPPRDLHSHGELADWQAFLETWVAQYLTRLGQLAGASGVDLPRAAGDPVEYLSPVRPALTASRVDLYGFAGGAGGAFGGSLGAAHFEPFRAETRPLTGWQIGCRGGDERSRLREVVAGIAHGLKGLGVGAETPGPALIRLLHWLEDAGEELTASVELRDAIAYLDYLPYARLTPDDVPAAPTAGRAAAEAARKRFGLHALLLTCGYNPTVLDLEAVDDLDLAEFPVAVFPSLGYLGVDAYGKLVVFTLHGGSLITLPEPAVREVDGTPLNTRFLWPHPAGQGPPRWSATLLPWRSRLRRAGTGESVPFSGRCLTFPAAGRPFVRYGRTGAGEVPRAATEAVTAQVLMTAGGVPAAYRVQVRSGTSTVVGAALGAEYLTPAYARLAPAARRTLRRVLLDLFEETTPRQIVPDDHLDLEAIARLSPDGGSLLFVINRLGGQSGRLHFPVPESLNIGRHPTATVLFSGAGSTATGRAGGVTLDLAPGDAMVLRLT